MLRPATYPARGDLKGRVLNPDAATQDAVHPVVVRHPGAGRKALYVKLGSSASRADRIYRRFADRLAILSSGDNAFLCLGLMGAPGTVTAESNFAPRAIGDFLDAAHARELDRALALFSARRRYRDLFRDGLTRGLPMFVPYTKAAMEMVGLPVGRPRPPLEALGEREREALRETLRSTFRLEISA